MGSRRASAFPVIGITCPVSWNSHSKNYNYSIPKQYIEAVEAAGGLAFPLPPNLDMIAEQVSLLDGIVFTGGGDIDPSAYGCDVPHRAVYGVCDRRDQYEFELLDEALRQNLPLLGICRGLQLFNVGFGGTLWQDIDDERPRGNVALRHTGGGYIAKSAHYDGGYQRVRVRQESLMADVYRADVLEVNSYHHQAVRKLGTDLYICGRTADGVVESIAHKERPILGLQFHPEMMQAYRQEHRRPFRWLIAEATAVMAKAGGRRAASHAEDRERIKSLRLIARENERAAARKARQTARSNQRDTIKVNGKPTPIHAAQAPTANQGGKVKQTAAGVPVGGKLTVQVAPTLPPVPMGNAKSERSEAGAAD